MPVVNSKVQPTLTDLLFEKAGVGLCLVAPDSTVVRANGEWLRSTGYTEEQVVGENIVDLFPATREMALALHARARAGHRIELPRHAKTVDGLETWWEGSIEPVAMEGGTGLLITAREVASGVDTVRRAEAALQENEERLRVALDAAAFGTFDFDPATGKAVWDEQQRRIWGVPPDQAVDCAAILARVHPEDRDTAREVFANALSPSADGRYRAEYRIVRPDGAVRWCAAHGRVHFVGEGDARRAVRIVGVEADVTDRKNAEEALRDSEERFRLLVQGVKDCAIYMLAPDGTVTSWSAAAEQIFGYREEEIVGRHRALFFTEEDRRSKVPQRELEDAAEHGHCEHEAWRVRKDGALFWANVLITAVRDDRGRLRGFASVQRDFTDRKKSEAALRESEGKYVAIHDRAPFGIALTKLPEATFVTANDAFLAMFGFSREDVIGKTSAELGIADPDAQAVVRRELQRTGSLRDFEVTRRARSGARIDLSLSVERVAIAGSEYVLTSLQDVTQRKRAEEALRTSEERTRLAQQVARVGTFEWDLRSGVGTWSPELEAMHGLPRGGFAGTKAAWERLVHPDDRTEAVRRIEETLETGAPVEVEWRVVWPDGSVHWLAGRAQAFKDGSGEPARLTGINMDVTERKASEARLAYLASFPEKNPNPVVEVGVEGRVTYANPVALDLFPDLVGEGKEHPWVAGADLAADSSSLTEPAVAERAVTIGDRTFVQTLVRLPGQGIRIYAAEITARERAERALRAKEAELALILDRTPFMLVRCSRDLRYRYASAAYARMIGRTPDEIAGRPIVEILGVQGLETIRPRLEAVLRGEPVEYEDDVHFEGVGVRRLHVVNVPDRDERDQIVGWLSNIVDLTEQRHAEALRVANAQLREADRNRNQFLAMLSHELRNPLAPIRNSLYILTRAAPGGEQARHAQTVIERQIGQMTRLVDDLLDVTRVTRGKIRLQREPLDLNDLVQRTVEDHRTLFAKSDIRLDLLPASVEVPVNGDRVRLAQAVSNLLQNAAKFTPAGGATTVWVEVDAERREAVLTVQDTGIGVRRDMLARLFDPFTQVDATLDRSKGGLGLGLALVKGLAEMHGGSVSAASAGPGQGSAFTIRLPLDTAAARAVPQQRAEPRARARAPRRVLVIEDNEDAADTLREVLELGDHVVEVAYSGRRGIEKARTFHPDVVLCDIGLPEMDGYEVARKMRADPGLGQVALVAVSGYAQPEDVAAAREAGFDAHLAKPPSPEALERVLANLRSVSPDRPAPT